MPAETGATPISNTARLRISTVSLLAMWPELVATAVYFFFAAFSVTHHKLWFDEVNTALLGRLPFEETWMALSAGADTNPPLLYVPVHLLYRLTSNAELACRLPSILEYFLMMGSIYLIAGKYVSRLYALVAAFVPFLTIAGSYAVEGRGYAATLGFSAAALLCWRNAAVQSKRALWLIGIFVSSAAAVSCHYSAALIFTALGGGEAVRIAQRKRIDWAVAAAIVAGASPLFLFRPLMTALHEYLLSYWAKPSLHEVFSSLAGWKLAGLLLAVLFGLHLFRRLRGGWVGRLAAAGPIPRYEIAAWVVLLLSPVQGYLQGLVTGGFTMRYALPMAIPIALFTGIYAFRVLRGSRFAALVLLAILLSMCVERFWIVTVRPIVFEAESNWIGNQSIPGSERLVVGNGVVFSPMYFYAGEPLKSRLAYVCNPALSTQYLHMNSPDLNLSKLRAFSPMPVFDLDAFMKNNPEFALADDGESWLLKKLMANQVPIEKLTCSGAWCIYNVHSVY